MAAPEPGTGSAYAGAFRDAEGRYLAQLAQNRHQILMQSMTYAKSRHYIFCEERQSGQFWGTNRAAQIALRPQSHS